MGSHKLQARLGMLFRLFLDGLRAYEWEDYMAETF